MSSVRVPSRPPVPAVSLPHDSQGVLAFEKTSFSATRKAAIAFTYLFLLFFLALFYFSDPTLNTAAAIIIIAVLSAWLAYRLGFRSR